MRCPVLKQRRRHQNIKSKSERQWMIDLYQLIKVAFPEPSIPLVCSGVALAGACGLAVTRGARRTGSISLRSHRPGPPRIPSLSPFLPFSLSPFLPFFLSTVTNRLSRFSAVPPAPSCRLWGRACSTFVLH
eukprot:1024209-Rhodomonas_salina.3